MSWFAAVCYGVAVLLLLGALGSRADPLVRRLLGDRRSPELIRGQAGELIRSLRARWPRCDRGSARNGIAAGMPDLLDVVAVSVTAGLSPRLALERAPDVVAGPVGGVFEGIRREVALGTTWGRALDAAGSRLDVEELRRLALTLTRAERLGSPVAERLRDLATDVRAERRARREERARKAPIQMLFPLVFLILPAFVLAAVVPALIVATRDVI